MAARAARPTTTWPTWWPGAWPPRGRRPSPTRWPPWSAWPTATPGPCSPPSRWPWPWPATRPVTLDDVERARHTRLQHYGEDDHYDQVSALIKSIRGSDPDAGLYWLARMLESGEDARFIARRLVILASEDVGEADPLALVVADAAARAVEFVGLPEAQLNLAQAVVHLACAPKSNRVTVALGRARRDVREAPRGDVPDPPARRPLPERGDHRPRRGLRLPPRPPGRLRRPGVPAGGGGRPPATTSRATGATRRWWPSGCGAGAAGRRGRRPPGPVTTRRRTGRRPDVRAGDGRDARCSHRDLRLGQTARVSPDPLDRGPDASGGSLVAAAALVAGRRPRWRARRRPGPPPRPPRRGPMVPPGRHRGRRAVRRRPCSARRRPATRITVDVALRPRDPAALDAFVRAVSTPGNPRYHHYLAAGQFGRRLRPDAGRPCRPPGTGWPRPGSPSGRPRPDGLVVPVTGTAAQVEAAFAVPLVQARLADGRTVRLGHAGPVGPGRPGRARCTG